MKRLIIRGVGLVLREANSSECFYVQDFLTSPSICGTKQKRVPFWKSWFQRWIILSYFSTIITWKHSKAGKRLIDWALLDAICFFSFSFFSFFLQVCIDMVSLGSSSITKLEWVEDVHGIGRLWREFQCWKAQTSAHHLATWQVVMMLLTIATCGVRWVLVF